MSMAPTMSKDQDGLRRSIVAACREMNALGINQGTSGNISVRLPDRPGFLVTPSGIPYDAMEPAMIVEMDFEGGYRGGFLPSSEWRMHLDILRTRPEAGAVVHTHATHATALSCLRIGIPPFHYMVAAGGGTDIRCADYATFGTPELSARMLEALAERTACLLANHGMICLGPSLNKAMWLAVEVEAMARQYLAARLMGEPVLLDDAEMTRILGLFRGYGKQPEQLAEGETLAFAPPARRDEPSPRKRASSAAPRRRPA
jgi:L-fuculose-phosphate aldolase